MNNVTPPMHPLPPGGQMPDLNLAGCDGYDPDNRGMQSQPDPARPTPYTPTLHGSLELGGIDPAAPVPILNLAGVEGVPPPAQLLKPAQSNAIHLPDFGLPDFTEPTLQQDASDSTGIIFDQPTEFAADPMLPDLDSYRRPYGLDIHNLAGDASLTARNALWQPDPQLSDLLNYEVPSGASLSHDPLALDPLLPDLQQPQMAQDVTMPERPGELDGSALHQMHEQPLYRQIAGVPYNQVFMDQSGMNTTQRRYNDLLMGGLDSTGGMQGDR